MYAIAVCYSKYMTYDIIIRVIADGAVVPVILIGAYMLVFKVSKGHRFEAYCRVVMAGLTAYLIAKLIGAVYQPSAERPFEVLGVPAGALFLNNPGFPSDHALFVTAITAAVWFETKNKLISTILVFLVVVVCVGRVLALVHTPLDVIAGVAIGLMGCVWYIYPRRTLRT
jgi:membrane-associated phospholipid phosphatase